MAQQTFTRSALPTGAAMCTCTASAPSQRVLHRYPLDYYSRPCHSAQYVLEKNGTQARCDEFAFTGRRQLSDCLAEAANYTYTQ